MSLQGALAAVAYAAVAVAALRLVLSYKSAVYAVRRLWRCADEWAQAYQYHEVPRFACDGTENPLFRKASAYVAALPSLEDADAASVLLSSASRTNGGLSLQLGPGHTARDAFQGARLAWTNAGSERLVLRVRRHDRTRVLRPYLQHVESVADEMEQRRRELRLYLANTRGGWASAPFTHPATLESVAMDPELKARVRADLESFLKGRAYYHRLGRAWRRSYLLYGPPGTGKSTFAAAMARFLGYDVYDHDLSRAAQHGGGDDLRALLMRTTPRSLILVEDLDRHLQQNEQHDLVGFMDGVASCCGEERVMVFTMRGGKDGLDAAVLRPGRLDVHIQFTLCDFEAFKALASNYLGLRDHKLYPQVEEGFQAAGARLSAAELGEIMLANRASPTRALRTVITKLQNASGGAQPRHSATHRRNTSWSGAGQQQWEEQPARGSADSSAEADGAPPACGVVFGKDAPPMRELKKLYGLIRIRSRREGSGVVPFEGDAHGPPTPANHDRER
ncbi:unnamed protein product [Urochloa decumbens]|uniref:AAA+ ATPase domain-containing protein n=1 Tax=Urochloa decumbens TaxID=240449 RepID=A0ABC8X9N6_9POAL